MEWVEWVISNEVDEETAEFELRDEENVKSSQLYLVITL